MARGYPDYFGTSYDPRMGVYTVYRSGNVPIPNNILTTIFDLTFKMVLFGGNIRITGVPDKALIIVHHTIDGAAFPTMTLSAFDNYQLHQPNLSTFFWVKDDLESNYYVIGVTKGIICQSQFKFEILQTTGGPQLAQADILYGRIVR